MKPHPGAGPEHTNLLEKRLEVHAKFVCNLLGKRSCSLASQYLRPPFRYAGLLSPDHRKATQTQMDLEWKRILHLEAEFSQGFSNKPLEAVHSLMPSWVRLLVLCNEADIACNTQEALDITVASLQHMNDTICIESTHCGVKDCFSIFPRVFMGFDNFGWETAWDFRGFSKVSIVLTKRPTPHTPKT